LVIKISPVFKNIFSKYKFNLYYHLFKPSLKFSDKPTKNDFQTETLPWLDLILKKELKQVVDWNNVDKDDYLSAMQRSVVKDLEIKTLLKKALTDQIDNRVLFMIGIDVSYYYEGYSEFKTEEL